LSAIVSIVTLLAALLLGPAWPRSLPDPGSTDDSGFWFLLQNSIMQLLGLFTAVFPIHHGFFGAAGHWAMLFAATGSLNAIAAIPAYLYLPTFWSGLFSFIGVAAQAFIALQFSLLTSSAPIPY
jgi:hypothetical protein